MSRIDSLIAEHCPSGVPVRALGDVGEFVRGNGLQKKDFVEEGVGCIHYGQIYTFYGTATRTTKSFVTPQLATTLRKARPGDLIVTTTSENIEDVGKAVAWLGDTDVAIGGHSCVLSHSLDPLYAAYFFQSAEFHRQKTKFVKGTKVKELAIRELAQIQLHVPPLHIQREIVSILVEMEELEAELEEELEAEVKARLRQYEHYREALLSFRERAAVPWTTLPQISVNRDSCRRPVTKAARVPGPIPYYGASGIVDYVSEFIFDGDYLLVSEDGANLLARSSPIAFSAGGKSWINNHAHVLEFGTYVGRRFVEIYLNSIDLAPYVSGGAQPKLNQASLNRIPIPAPPVEDQEHLVSILDSFDALVSRLSADLSGELKARRQQYEYYRNRLLTFDEAPT